MKCKEAKENIFNFLEQKLGEEKAQEFNEHINKCDLCQNEFIIYKQLQNAFSSIEEIEPSRDYKLKFWANAQYKSGRKFRLFHNKKYVLALAATIIIMVALSILVNRTISNKTNIDLTAQDLKDIEFMNEIQELIRSPLIENTPAIIITDEELKALETSRTVSPKDNNINIRQNNEVILKKIKEVNYA